MPPRRKKPIVPHIPLPKVVHNHLGPWPIVLDAETAKKEEAAGMCDYTTRQITLDSTYTNIGQWQILGHEILHMIMYDAGVDTGVEDKIQELVCDAFGTWFASAIRSGYLVVDDTKA